MSYVPNQLYYLFHPDELRAIVQWKVWHNPVHERNEETEPPSLQICFSFLDRTSRSFSSVIKELNPELLVPICIFYLILRGLDTIEDDMTISAKGKEPILRDFHNILEKDGWKFDGCGPNEKDRELLVRFNYVIEEYKKIKPEYKVIIKYITEQMGNGMADYALKAEENDGLSVETVEDYEKYCHYVAGLVGEGLTRLFVESGFANPALLKRPDLYESMGQFLQQTNIIRDIREDLDDKRRFWPKTVWSKYVDNFEDLFKPENQEAALRCSSEMVLIALERATDCMFYLAGMKDQSVFNFAAIPQAMAIATLELCFRNPAIFQRNVKISKGSACQLMVDSSQNLQTFYGAFQKYARLIHKKNNPMDPNFLRISASCGKHAYETMVRHYEELTMKITNQIEQFIESIFPTQDPKSIVRAASASTGIPPPATKEETEVSEKQKLQSKEDRKEAMYLALAVFGTLAFMMLIMFVVAWYLGARFDLAWQQIKQGNLTAPDGPADLQRLAAEKAKREL